MIQPRPGLLIIVSRISALGAFLTVSLIKRTPDSAKGQIDPGQHPNQLEIAGAPESVRFDRRVHNRHIRTVDRRSRRRSARQALDIAREGWVMTPRLFAVEVWTLLDEIGWN